MMIMPESLNTLYMNGVIDYIPYDIYAPSTSPAPASVSSNTSGRYPSKSDLFPKDEFVPSENSLNYRETIMNEADDKKSKPVLKSGAVWKGLAALALIIATPILIIKGFKKSGINGSALKSFWEKINPKNWFKKN